jgi:hypothetical protein
MMEPGDVDAAAAPIDVGGAIALSDVDGRTRAVDKSL